MWYLARCLFNNTTSAAPVTDQERGGCGERATRFFDGTKVPNFQALCRTWYGSAAGSHHVLQNDVRYVAFNRLALLQRMAWLCSVSCCEVTE